MACLNSLDAVNTTMPNTTIDDGRLLFTTRLICWLRYDARRLLLISYISYDTPSSQFDSARWAFSTIRPADRASGAFNDIFGCRRFAHARDTRHRFLFLMSDNYAHVHARNAGRSISMVTGEGLIAAFSSNFAAHGIFIAGQLIWGSCRPRRQIHAAPAGHQPGMPPAPIAFFSPRVRRSISSLLFIFAICF